MPIATPADFKRASETERLKAAREITLPSGLVVLAWQPSLDWWILECGRLPETMAVRTLGLPPGGNGNGKVTTQTVVEMAHWTAKLIEAIVVEPKIRLNPANDNEVNANLVTNEDLNFLFRFAGGEVTVDGRDLAAFRDERRPPDGGDPGGQPLAHAPEPAA